MSEQLIAFALAEDAALSLLQSRLHEHWAHFFGSTLGDGARYTPSTCFETFPFPEGWREHPGLNAAGAAYHAFRADLITRTNLGLTKTYNRFHDPDEQSEEIRELRRLHLALDLACFEAYGWADLAALPEAQLLGWKLRHEEDAEAEEEPGAKPKKKAWRYAFLPEVEAEVFGRLLALNAARAAAEAAQAPVAAAKGARGRPKKAEGPPAVVQPTLFG